MSIKIENRNNRQELQTILQEPQTKIWNKMFVSIFFANMALNLGQQMSNSLLAKYADSLGAPATQVGMLMSMFAVTALLLRFVAGPAMDTYNRKYLIMGAMGIMATAYFGFSISKSISSLMVFRLLQGCGNAFANVCCLAMVSEALPKDKFGTGMGYYSLAQVVSQAIGPTIGLYLVDWFGYNTTYSINGFVMLTAIVVANQIKINFKRTSKLKITLNNIIAKEAIVPASILLFMAIGFHTINSFLMVFAGKQGVTSNIGLFFTVYALTMLLTRPLIGKLTDKYGLVKVGIPSIILTGCSFLIISVSTTLSMFLVAAFINAFGYGACQPALQSLAMKAVPRERRGSGSSTNFIGMDLGTIIGPTLAGTFAQKLGYVAMWRYMMIPFAIGILIMFILRHKIILIEEEFKSRTENNG
jgi:MFS family permease